MHDTSPYFASVIVLCNNVLWQKAYRAWNTTLCSANVNLRANFTNRCWNRTCLFVLNYNRTTSVKNPATPSKLCLLPWEVHKNPFFWLLLDSVAKAAVYAEISRPPHSPDKCHVLGPHPKVPNNIFYRLKKVSQVFIQTNLFTFLPIATIFLWFLLFITHFLTLVTTKDKIGYLCMLGFVFYWRFCFCFFFF